MTVKSFHRIWIAPLIVAMLMHAPAVRADKKT